MTSPWDNITPAMLTQKNGLFRRMSRNELFSFRFGMNGEIAICRSTGKIVKPHQVCSLAEEALNRSYMCFIPRFPRLDLDLIWSVLRVDKEVKFITQSNRKTVTYHDEDEVPFLLDPDLIWSSPNYRPMWLDSYAPDSASSLIDLREARKAWGL